jgi:hypothetical protein
VTLLRLLRLCSVAEPAPAIEGIKFYRLVVDGCDSLYNLLIAAHRFIIKLGAAVRPALTTKRRQHPDPNRAKKVDARRSSVDALGSVIFPGAKSSRTSSQDFLCADEAPRREIESVKTCDLVQLRAVQLSITNAGRIRNNVICVNFALRRQFYASA